MPIAMIAESNDDLQQLCTLPYNQTKFFVRISTAIPFEFFALPFLTYYAGLTLTNEQVKKLNACWNNEKTSDGRSVGLSMRVSGILESVSCENGI